MVNTCKTSIASLIIASLLISGCASMNRTQKGAVVGTAGGAAAGAVIGRATGNTALGTIIGATVGGVAGAVIGKQMDKQAEEIKQALPEASVEREGEGIIVELNNQILFGFDQSDLTQDARDNLDKIVAVLVRYPDTDIEIQGHTDSKGTSEYNQTLSVRRAGTVYNYLTANNVAETRLAIKGFGEEVPKYTNDTEEGRAQNRRVEFLITANEKMKAEAEQASKEN